MLQPFSKTPFCIKTYNGLKAIFKKMLTLSPLNKLSSAKYLVCINFQSASMLLNVGESVV